MIKYQKSESMLFSKLSNFAFLVTIFFYKLRITPFPYIEILGSVACQQRLPDSLGRLLPEIPDGMDPTMMRNRRTSAYNPREIGFDRRTQFERTDSLRTINTTNPIRRKFLLMI